MATAPTGTTAAAAPTARVALYNLTFGQYSPSTAAMAVNPTEDIFIPSNRKINTLNLQATGNGLNLTNDLILYGTAPLTLGASSLVPGNVINLGTKNITCTWNGYAGTTSTFATTRAYITNGSMTLIGRGGGTSGSTFNFPFSGTVAWFSGSGATVANGSTILTVKVSDLGAPSNVNATGTGIPFGNRAFKIETASTLGATPIGGTNPTVRLNFNAQDNLTVNQNILFLSEGTALNGPWNVRSAVYGATAVALPATGNLITSTTLAPGPITITGTDFYAWSSKVPTITNVTPLSLCASSGFFTLKGTSLLGVSAVSIAGAPVNSFTVVADTMITGYVGAGTTGVATVTKFGSTYSGTQTITLTGAPAAPIVTPTAATIILGDSPSFTASGTTTGTYAWYSTFTGGTAIATTATYVTAPVCQSANLYVAINDGTCEGARATVPITVNPMPTLSSTTPTFCGTGGTTTLSLAPAYTGLTYTWSNLTPSSTLSTTTGDTTIATLTVTSDFKLKVSNNGCADSSYISIGVYPLPTATVTTTASGVCPGTAATIGSGLSAGNFTVTSIPHVPTTAPANAGVIMNNGVAVTPLSGGTMDDGGWGNIPIGFNFNYFGNTFSTISAGTNGLLMFGTPPGYGTATGQLGQFTFNTTGGVFPNVNNPGNIIALMAGDLHMGNSTNGSIKYWVEGYAPNRKFIIEYKNIHGYSNNPKATVHCILYETLGIVEIHILEKTFSNNCTVGLQDATKTIGAVAPGRVATSPWTITTPEAWRFAPPSNYNTIWTATDLTGTTTLANATNVFSQTVAPAVTTTYNISYTDLTTGCTNAPNSAQVQMLVLGTVAPANVNAVAADSSVCWGSPTLISLDYTGILDGLTFQWQESTNGGTTWTNITGATANSYTAAPQAPSMFRCYIASCNGVADTTSACTVALNNFTTCYCISAASSATDEEIFNVSIGSLNNTSDCSVIAPGTSSLLNRYSNYTNGTNAPAAPSIEKCLPIPFSVTVGACSQFGGGTGLAVFVDLNQNGLFTDAGEKVYSNGATANIMSVPSTIVNGNITIPNSALTGLTRMRVMSVWNSSGNAINPCMTYTWGETEDYLIDILPLANCPTINGLTVSNITNNEATLSWNVGCNPSTDFDIFMTGSNGSNVFLNNINPTIVGGVGTYTLTSLDQTTTYSFDLRADCGVDSSNALSATFTTFSNCNNPFALNLSNGTASDSIFGSWQWQSWDPALYQVSGFNLEYGMLGFTPTTGTVYLADANFADTILDQNLLAGGVYQVYVQAICSNGDTSGYSSPITIIMPVDNDTVCGAEMLGLNTEYIFNNTGATVSLDEINIAPPATGAQTTDGWINSTLDKTTWFKFVAPSTGSVRINSTGTNYNGQSAVYDVALCSDFNNNFNLIAANDNAIGGTSLAPNYTVCGLTPGNTYYIMHDGFTATAGNYAIKITEIILEAGASNPVSDICYGDTINLYTTINSNDLGGSWSAPLASSNASIYNDSLFTSTGLAYQTFNFQYRVVDGCAYDSIISQVKIFAPSNAGQDGIINACRNEPIDLLSGLTVNADFGGNWFDPSNNAIPSSQITTGNFGGASFNYDYIVGNGVCPDDTANVVVNVGTCNWLDITEETFAGVEVYPNPTNGVVFVAASINAGNFSYEVTDANGRIIAEAINGVTAAATTSIDLSKVEIGVYFITLSNATAKKVYRIVVQ